MKSEWDKGMKLTWGDIISLEYGKPVPDKFQTNGDVPVFGTNGQIGTSNLPPLCNRASSIVGRKGAYRGVHYSRVPFSVIDTAFYVKELTDKTDSKWIYYKLLTLDINRMDSGSAIPSTDRYEIYSLPVSLPPLPIQRKIASILSSLDDKIETNNAICRNLEEQAMALYKSWFVDFELFGRQKPCDWKEKDIYSVCEIIYGAPFSSKLFNQEKKGLPLIRIRDLNKQESDVYTDEVHPKAYIIHAGDIVVGMDGEFSPYIWGGDAGFLNQRVCVFKNKRKKGSFFLYFSIKPQLEYIEQTEMATTVIHIGKKDFDAFSIFLPSEKILDSFDDITFPFYEEIIQRRKENRRLTRIRESLLPRLMSGELTVKEIN